MALGGGGKVKGIHPYWWFFGGIVLLLIIQEVNGGGGPALECGPYGQGC